MFCAIYKSLKKYDTYLYVAAKDDFSRVPESLFRLLGQPVHVIDLELSPERKLAQEDVVEVMKNLQEQGWHLQMPKKEEWVGAH